MSNSYDLLKKELCLLKESNQSMVREIAELKQMLMMVVEQSVQTKNAVNAITEKFHVNDVDHSEALIIESVGPGLNDKRVRDVTIHTYPVPNPTGTQIKSRQRVRDFIEGTKLFKDTHGNMATPEASQNLLRSLVNDLDSYVLHETINRREKLDIDYNHKQMNWKKVPQRYIDEYVRKIEDEAVRRGFFFDRCVNNWAAHGMLADHYGDRYNLISLKRKSKKTHQVIDQERSSQQENNLQEEENGGVEESSAEQVLRTEGVVQEEELSSMEEEENQEGQKELSPMEEGQELTTDESDFY
ncbi:unnamed protein product [Rhizopus stolonifer]